MREMSCNCSSVRRGGESRVLQLAKTWGRTSFFPRNVGVCSGGYAKKMTSAGRWGRDVSGGVAGRFAYSCVR